MKKSNAKPANNKSPSLTTNIRKTDNKVEKAPSLKAKVPRRSFSALQKSVCGLTDPFCEHARGAKYMDESSTRTLPFTIEENFVLGTDALGNCGMLVCPTINYSSLVTPNNNSGTTMNFTTNRAAVVAPLTGVSKFRIVSVGYKVKCVAPALTASGMVYFRTFAVEGAGAMASIPGATYACSSHLDIPLVDCKDVTVIVPHTSQMPQHFYDPALISPSTTVAAWSAPGFCPSTVTLSGCPASTPCVHFTFIMHVEFVFSDGEPLALATTPTPPMSDIVRKAAGQVTASLGDNYETSSSRMVKRIEDKAFSAIEKFGETAIQAALGMFV